MRFEEITEREWLYHELDGKVNDEDMDKSDT
jgi:hypothetical protein